MAGLGCACGRLPNEFFYQELNRCTYEHVPLGSLRSYQHPGTDLDTQFQSRTSPTRGELHGTIQNSGDTYSQNSAISVREDGNALLPIERTSAQTQHRQTQRSSSQITPSRQPAAALIQNYNGTDRRTHDLLPTTVMERSLSGDLAVSGFKITFENLHIFFADYMAQRVTTEFWKNLTSQQQFKDCFGKTFAFGWVRVFFFPEIHWFREDYRVIRWALTELAAMNGIFTRADLALAGSNVLVEGAGRVFRIVMWVGDMAWWMNNRVGNAMLQRIAG